MAAACYVGVILVLLALENSLVYHPIREAEEWLPPPNQRVEDVSLATLDYTPIHAWWCPAEDGGAEQGAVLYCHGNAGNLSHRGASIQSWLQGVGLPVLIFDYPGYGRSGGTVSEAGCYAAADAAYDWLTRIKQIPPEKVVLYGDSLGGGVAVDLASRRPHRALVLVNTFTSIPDVATKLYPWLPVRWLMRNRFDSGGKIGRCKQPVLIAHGTADRLVPFVQGQRLFATAHEPKQFFAMEGYDHNDRPDPLLHAKIRLFLAQAASGVSKPASVP